MSLNKDMGDAHEAYLAALFDGVQARGSGNQWRAPMDGRTSRYRRRFAFAWDGKSTLGSSVGVSRSMVDKAVEQAGGERPMIGIRFYRDEKLRVDADWVAVRADDMAEVLQAAEASRIHARPDSETDAVAVEQALRLADEDGLGLHPNLRALAAEVRRLRSERG